MKILYICQYYLPEPGAPSVRASELAKYWVRAGHEVTVLTGFPNHPNGKVPPEYRAKLRRLVMRERMDGVEVARTWLLPLPNRKSWERMLNYSSFAVSAALRGLFLPRPDVLIATSPQLLVGLSGLVIAKLRRIPFIFEVRDLWPESLVAVGVSRKDSFIYRALALVARLLYRCADHIVVVSPPFKDCLRDDWGIDERKVSVMKNGIDTEMFETLPNDWAKPEGEFWVSFIGTIGNAHGLETLIAAARTLRNSHPDIKFIVAGDGAERAKIEELARIEGLANLRILGPQPRAKIPGLIAASDVCLSLLKKSDVFKTVLPTKMMEFMACGRPVILGVEGYAKQMLEDAEAGVSIPPEDPVALCEAVLRFRADRELGPRLGANGRRYAFERLSRACTASEYAALCATLAAGAKAPER